jgi:hypothetical protein
MYVVAIDASKDDIEATDYKVFEKRKDAEDRFYRAWALILRQKPVFDPGRPVHLYAARLYEVDAWHPRAAIAAVQAGAANLIMDTDDPDPSIDLEELVPDMFAD